MDPKQQAPNQRPETPRLTGLKKRQQIEIAGRVMFLWVAIAAAALSVCAATGQYLFSRWLHNNRVIEAKAKASETLSANIINAKELTKEVDALVSDQPLATVKTDPKDQNTKSVLDALPTTFDPAALATSLQLAILNKSGVSIENITVPQESTDVAGPSESVPQQVKVAFVISGNYENIKKAIVDVERTIRPIKVTNINLAGTDANLRATVEAITYYQPAKNVDVKEEVIK